MSAARVLMIGFGGVGQTMAMMLSESHSRFPKLDQLDLQFIGIVTHAHGALYSDAGINMDEALQTFKKNARFLKSDPFYSNRDTIDLVQHADYDILVELSTLSIENNGEPAVGHVQAALKRGKHVVTANKGPAAFAWHRLSQLAAENNCHFKIESCVMDGAPIFNMAASALKGATISAVSGVVNSTTNFVLEAVAKGTSKKEAISKAQSLGFAEANSAYDLDGWDSAAKLSVLCNVLMNKNLSPTDIERQSFPENIISQIGRAKAAGKIIKQIIRADNNLQSVRFEQIDTQDPLARVSGSGSMLIIETDAMAPLIIQQTTPGLTDTAYGVLNDLIEITQK